MVYLNAQEAFEDLYYMISEFGTDYDNTKALFNTGFTILDPMDNTIQTPWRNWSKEYADYEWEWYLSGERSAEKIAQKAKIWYNCMDANGEVNSNYGWHWNQNKQLDYVINELSTNPNSRRAAISIYNSKDRWNFENDTPCTFAIQFYILDDQLNMNVMMRSNDLWYGFCNDQYFFSKLQMIIYSHLYTNIKGLKIGSYYHHVNNLHIYNKFLNRNGRI